jgi:hypothetical protein
MYIISVVAFMFVLPVSFVLGEASIAHVPLSAALVQKWFVFWAVGVRLSSAGLRQMFQPGYTAKVVLSLKGEEALLVVRELGMANLSIGLVGLVSLVASSWQPAAALAGVIFYSLAGVNHALQNERGRPQNMALISDLLIAVVLLVALASANSGAG